MDTQTFLDNFATVAEAPGGIHRLRSLILDLAMRGRLIAPDEAPQDHASLQTHADHEAASTPFPLPSHWRWRRLDEIATYNGRPNCKPEEIPPTAWVLDLEDIEKGSSRLLDRVRASDRPSKSARASFQSGDVLYGRLRPYLDKVLVADEPGFATTEIIPIVPQQEVDPLWLRLSLKRPDFLELIERVSYGVKMPRLGTKDAKSSLHPVPPLAEQQRIVAKVDELMALCDELEAAQQQREHAATLARTSALHALTTAGTDTDRSAAWSRISDNWKSIADSLSGFESLRQLIRVLAVAGDLTSRSDEGPARPPMKPLEALRLREAKLWRASPARSKLPERWQTYPLAQLGRWGSGGTPTRNRAEFFGGVIPWAVIGDLNDDRLFVTSTGITSEGLESSSATLIPADSVLIAMYGSIGKLSITGIECSTNQAIAHCVPDPELVLPEYLFLLLRSIREELLIQGKGAAQQNISQTVLKHLLVDLPPLDEQRAIVEKVGELLALSDQLEAAKSDAQYASALLAESLGSTQLAG